jgi:hypothetical protein
MFCADTAASANPSIPRSSSLTTAAPMAPRPATATRALGCEFFKSTICRLPGTCANPISNDPPYLFSHFKKFSYVIIKPARGPGAGVPPLNPAAANPT